MFIFIFHSHALWNQIPYVSNQLQPIWESLNLCNTGSITHHPSVFRLPIHLVPKLGLSAKGGLQLPRFGRPKRGWWCFFFKPKKTGKIWHTKYQLPSISLSEFFCMYMMIWRFIEDLMKIWFFEPFPSTFRKGGIVLLWAVIKTMKAS